MIQKYIYILAIESSCDDTSVSILRGGIPSEASSQDFEAAAQSIEILSNCVAGQEAHRIYGGVVPEVASRAHQQNIVPTIDWALKKANIAKKDLHAIAFTRGPGLIGSLLVGVSFAKAFALSLGLPLIAVNHIDAHVLAHFAESPRPSFPFLCLTVSGGHTQIVKVESPENIQILGETLDDAAGEAFDKTGKLLDLGYPAGPIIDRLAKEGTPIYDFPEPNMEGLNFSFSGLKTAILYFLKKELKENQYFIQENLNNICASVQATIVKILMRKLKKAAKETNIKHIAIAGGVSANSALREALILEGKKLGWITYIPKFEYCTDNAAMIAVSAYAKFLKQDFTNQAITPSPRM
jgi:N6-L-threonylcarbamoyladenine synthase